MDDLIKLVRTYRLTAALTERARLGDNICSLVEPHLRHFVFAAMSPPAAEDVLQEVLRAVTTGLDKFRNDSAKQFWAWCYRIARNKINDQFRKNAADRLQPMQDEDLQRLVESSPRAAALSAADRHDLEYALNLLARSHPECREYLWQHYVIGVSQVEIAEEQNKTPDAVRMKINRCLDEAKALVA